MTPDQYRQAAAEIRRRGKATGVYEELDGSVCALGAMRAVLTEDGVTKLQLKDVQPVAELTGVSRRFPQMTSLGQVAIFSDDPDTTAEDIAILFEQVAEKLEANQS